MSDTALIDAWRAEAARPHEGWDFSHLDGRITEDKPPWDFAATCRHAIPDAASVLDMGTGGGEWLATFADILPTDTVATEGWAPNVAVASANLARYGINVVRQDGDRIPFGDARFGLILNRHESFDAGEVARTLRPGGVFLTQQVGGDDFAEAHTLFGSPPEYPDWTLTRAASALTDAGLRIAERAEWHGPSRFHDVGALVSYFALVPWDVPADFGVDAYAETLLALHRDGPAVGRPITFTSSRFWLRAIRPR